MDIQKMREEVHKIYQACTGKDLSKEDVPVVPIEPGANVSALIEKEVGDIRAICTGLPMGAPEWMPAARVVESRNTLTILLEVPGVSEENVNAEIKDGYLRISGEKQVNISEGQIVTISEVPTGRFLRCFPLSACVDPTSLKTKMQSGILKIDLLKKDMTAEQTKTANAGK